MGLNEKTFFKGEDLWFFFNCVCRNQNVLNYRDEVLAKVEKRERLSSK